MPGRRGKAATKRFEDQPALTEHGVTGRSVAMTARVCIAGIIICG